MHFLTEIGDFFLWLIFADIRSPLSSCSSFCALGIGWQLLYEGMWKINTLSTQSPWSSDGYLKSAQGPFRGLFRSMSGDPDDKSWLDPDSGCCSLG